MEWLPVDRPADAFQRPVTPDQIRLVVARGLGGAAVVVRAEELGGGTYNTVFRLRLADGTDVVLRVAPVARNDADTRALRNEWAAAPFLLSLEPLVPRALAADFSHDIVDRDWVISTLVPGVPADDLVGGYGAPARLAYFRQLGEVTGRVHAVRGPAFGAVAGPARQRWSDALADTLRERRDGYLRAGLDPSDAERVLAALERHRAVVDEVIEPRLVHGDLWTLNVLLDPEAAEPVITGVLDWDLASWADRWADWPLHQITYREPAEQQAFWSGYGDRPPDDGAARIRAALYSARSRLGAHLDIVRRGLSLEEIPDRYWSVAPPLELLEG